MKKFVISISVLLLFVCALLPLQPIKAHAATMWERKGSQYLIDYETSTYV